MSTAEIGLTVRTTNCLEEKGIFTVRDLLNTTRADLLSISNFGEKTLEEVFVPPWKSTASCVLTARPSKPTRGTKRPMVARARLQTMVLPPSARPLLLSAAPGREVAGFWQSHSLRSCC
ncbi:MAG: DNA-directed RNA polymerase subunit alpha C-terminal domain-containing protein [Pirellulaceae bacterium]